MIFIIFLYSKLEYIFDFRDSGHTHFRHFCLETFTRPPYFRIQQDFHRPNQPPETKKNDYNSFKLDRFRGISHADISGFKRINLFFGKNNCGKLSLLARRFFLTCGQSNPLLLLNINNFRDYRKIQKKDISLDFYKLDTEKEIQIFLYNEETRNLFDHILFRTSSPPPRCKTGRRQQVSFKHPQRPIRPYSHQYRV